MRDFKTIISVLKEYLKTEKTEKVFDKDVAESLAMSQSRFATSKRRNTTPYEEILEFCEKEKLCSNVVFFAQRSEEQNQV